MKPRILGKVLTRGFMGGAIMFFVIEILNHNVKDIWVNYIFKFGVLVPFLAYYLNLYKKHVEKGEFFYKGLIRGLILSAVIAFTYFGLNFLGYAISPTLAIVRDGFEINSMTDFLLINWIYFYELFVFGIITSFVLIQGMKGKISNNL